MKLAHEGHQGITKTKALLREKVWWPLMGKQVEEEVKHCMPCLSLSPDEKPEPINISEMKGPWETVHIDLYGPLPSGEHIGNYRQLFKVARDAHNAIYYISPHHQEFG